MILYSFEIGKYISATCRNNRNIITLTLIWKNIFIYIYVDTPITHVLLKDLNGNLIKI